MTFLYTVPLNMCHHTQHQTQIPTTISLHHQPQQTKTPFSIAIPIQKHISHKTHHPHRTNHSTPLPKTTQKQQIFYPPRSPQNHKTTTKYTKTQRQCNSTLLLKSSTSYFHMHISTYLHMSNHSYVQSQTPTSQQTPNQNPHGALLNQNTIHADSGAVRLKPKHPILLTCTMHLTKQTLYAIIHSQYKISGVLTTQN